MSATTTISGKTRIQKRFTERQMRDFKKFVADAPVGTVVTDAILWVYRALDPQFDERESVDPKDYQIPEDQAKEIIRLVKEKDNGIILAWLNWGPGVIQATSDQSRA